MGKETVDSLSRKAQAAVQKGDYDQARQFYQQALGIRHDNPDLHYGLGTACFMLGDLASAVYHFKEVTRLDPLRAGAFINLGAIFNRLEQLDDAIPMLQRGIQLDRTRAEGYYNLALVFRRLGKLEQAVGAYKEATKINPKMADAHYNVANLYLELGQHGLALNHYRHAVEIRPNWEKAVRGLEHAEELVREQRELSESPSAPSTPTEPTIDSNRYLDPTIHGNLLSALHQTTLDTEGQAKTFVQLLEKELEPALKDLSHLLMAPGTPPGEIEHFLRRFEKALAQIRNQQEALQTKTQRIKAVTDQMMKV